MARLVPSAASLRYLSSCIRSQPVQCSLQSNRPQARGVSVAVVKTGHGLIQQRDTLLYCGAKSQIRHASKVNVKDTLNKEFTLDEAIPVNEVKLRDSDSGTLGEPQSLVFLMRQIDREKQVVRLLHHKEGEAFAIVDIAEKEKLKELVKNKEERAAELAKQQRQSKTKQLELNWAISGNDLQLKLRQLRDFLEKGRKVEVLLASKKRQRKATPEEAQNVVKSIRAMINEMEGAKEIKAMEGQIGGQAMMTFQQTGGKGAPKQTSSQAQTEEAV